MPVVDESKSHSGPTTNSSHQRQDSPTDDDDYIHHTAQTPVIVVDVCSNNQDTCQSSLFLSSISRLQFGSINIPPVSYSNLTKKDIGKCYGPICETDPLSLRTRPSESVVRWADEALRSDRKSSAVNIGSFGCFTRNEIDTLSKFCEVQNVKMEIRAEDSWLLLDDNLTDAENNSIRDVLWNSKSHQTLLKSGPKSIDLQSFTTLAEERYIDNFVIDTVITKYIELERLNGNETAIYLPSEMFAWLSSSNRDFIQDKFAQVISCADMTKCTMVLMPIHMNNSHWGLVVVDLTNQRLLFDDGLRMHPERHVLKSVKKALDMITYVLCTSNSTVHFQSGFWNCIQGFQRFGMPYQRVSNETGQGSGSCGIGVILSAKDFAQHGLSVAGQFKWHFGEMRRLRKHLMLEIIKWMSSTV